MQQSIDDQYWLTASDLYKKKATVSLVDGDVRVTSGQRLATSAIAFEAGTSGASAAVRLFAQLNGVIPALADLEAAVAAKLPDDVSYDPITYQEIINSNIYVTDDGKGNLIGNNTTGMANQFLWKNIIIAITIPNEIGSIFSKSSYNLAVTS